jgi:hypothetical protein
MIPGDNNVTLPQWQFPADLLDDEKEGTGGQ